ncbi:MULTISPECIES: YceI family protein [unclassified Lysobacter]|uniref:YceI family protein n=1 Tax=unclassified Lysobacter TaxID=2635362 RepID=UPI0006F5BF88|nr:MULTISPECIES: YceI family protein [unclassified Lysobacter]KQZ59471.1 polyisoprenoid-binding protein [Lysobacter sp. Root559]KRC36515.1 polyisoprenoid-binding protein [Lysobacter sp. Root76]KRD64845.1 polyisoprenoid-binding protein [Lysobacter sp. Root96]
MKRTLLATVLAFAFAGAAAAAPLTYKIDANHTDVVASWSHFGFSNPIAHFGQVDGSITYDPAKPSSSSVEVTIPLAGLNSHVAAFDEHLRSEDFFDAAKYPAITFKSTQVEAAGDKKLKVSGDLTVHGVTKPVVLDVTINKVGEQPLAKRAAAGFDASTTIKRSDFGIAKYVPNVSDEVTIHITTEAIVPKPDAAKQ